MEIELKILEIDPEAVREKLRAAGCENHGREFQRNFMYDYPDRRLYEQQDGSYIRLRLRRWLDTEHSETLLTYKQTVSRTGFKIAEETETTVGDFEAMDRFLLKLGLEQIRLDEKLRETWTLDDIHFEIDEWAGLPPYLEIEAESEAAVDRGLALLGYSRADATAQNLREVLAKYKIEATSLRFADFGRSID
ncbi:MAG: class IV adenylate cyclase, partial [Candidatus Sericytochromatia bacterium]